MNLIFFIKLWNKHVQKGKSVLVFGNVSHYAFINQNIVDHFNKNNNSMQQLTFSQYVY